MGTFTVLGDAELSELSDAYGLGAVRSFVPIAAGTINSNFELRTERGAFFVRVNEGKSEDDVAWESRLVTALAGAGVVTPPPLVAPKLERASGRWRAGLDGLSYAPLRGAPGKWVSIFPWRTGSHVAAGDVTSELATRFGATLAGLHRAGLELPASWRRASIYDHDHLVGRFESFASHGDPQLAHAIAVLREELAIAGGAAPIRARATQGIIHGDLFRDNVLWQDGRVVAILDFEQASGGSLTYDLAVCINDWCWTDQPRIDLATAFIAGYQRVRTLTDGDREALPYEIRAAATRFTITRITDVYLARVTNPEKDFRDFLARVEAWRGPSLGQLTTSV